MDPMMAVVSVVALAIGAAAAWLARQGEIARLTAARDSERAHADARARDLETERIALSANRTRLEEIERAHGEKIASLNAVRGEIEKELKMLADKALKENQTSFMTVANEIFDKHRKLAAGDLDQRQTAIKSLIEPMQTTLAEYRKNLHEMEQSRKQAYGGLTNELKNVSEAQERVRTETSRLVNALRASPKTRGRWGEETLKNILELSGMTAYCDFYPEQSLRQDADLLRPDVLIRLPGERFMIVDAKTSLAGYMDAVEAEDDETRELHFTRHAQQLRTHMKRLAGKSYQDALEVTPDFVVMFIPGDNFYAAAIERDPRLYDDALRANVLIVTPTVLLGLAKAVAFGWRQEKVADNAREIAGLGQELYRRISTMGGHVAGLGQDLEKSVKRYNAFIGSLENSVMPQARRFAELEVEGADRALPAPAHIETELRRPRGDRDLSIETPPDPLLEPRRPISPAAE